MSARRRATDTRCCALLYGIVMNNVITNIVSHVEKINPENSYNVIIVPTPQTRRKLDPRPRSEHHGRPSFLPASAHVSPESSYLYN